MTCKNCGGYSPENSTYCMTCGASLRSDTPEISSVESIPSVVYEPPAVTIPEPPSADFTPPTPLPTAAPQTPYAQPSYAPPYAQPNSPVYTLPQGSPYYQPPQQTFYQIPPSDLEPTNGAAIASLILGAASIVFCLLAITGIPAIICAIVGLSTKKTSKGKGFAVAGLITGIISILATIAVVFAIIFAVKEAKSTSTPYNFSSYNYDYDYDYDYDFDFAYDYSSYNSFYSTESYAAVDANKYEVLSGFEQLNPPQKGEEIAVINTSEGIIKARLFPKQTPLAVANFKGLAQNKYYDGITFHRVINDFMIQGGDPKGTGTGGESLWKKNFENEIDRGLYHFRGALAMANAGKDTNSSQFFIVQAKNADTSSKDILDENLVQKYKELGGTPWLDGDYTVFGQVFEGVNVVDSIAAVATDSSDKPLDKIVINTITIEKY
ncbi:MAG: peptidylprolyl isomerase [Oscillospiraceae bacterium]|jgi:peptidyl-prolyl cis-trans isomerase B (cyclophilin B)|nr:peptidylprolyl isomerase [Oscillospiraceae bacterium]